MLFQIGKKAVIFFTDGLELDPPIETYTKYYKDAITGDTILSDQFKGQFIYNRVGLEVCGVTHTREQGEINLVDTFALRLLEYDDWYKYAALLE